tara:strand:- start:42 stop:236 length:195 start_codon:yes stop_codon:yes gene_type:complete
MADICKCHGQIGTIDCPYKEKCYRFTAKASDYQSYFMELPLKDGKCDHYWGKDGDKIWNKTEKL